MDWRLFYRWAPRIIAATGVVAITIVVSFAVGRVFRKPPAEAAIAGETPEQIVMRLAHARVAEKLANEELPLLAAVDMGPGDVGIFARPIGVLQVIDEQSFLAVIDDHTCLIEGVDTSRLADGRVVSDFSFDWFVVMGTTSYTAVTGGKRTVMVCRKLDSEKIKAAAKRKATLQPAGPST